ncbi:MAG TPA: hypothetical protein VI854_05310, partial [Acidimicrobiia bacterium]|nr:hypothetical protein [Acidimicrobiia bacterium]
MAQAAPAAGSIDRVSLADDESQRNFLNTGSTTGCTPFVTGKCAKRTVSDNGQSVVFTSRANNLVANDNNNQPDIFLWRAGQDVIRVSISADGGDANGPSEGPSISPNGEWIAFESAASNLKAGDISPGFSDVFVYHVTDGAMYKASVPAQAGQTPSGNSGGASVANNGTVAFGSFALNMVAGGNGGFQQIYVRRDPAGTGSTEMVSVVDGTTTPGDQVGKEVSIDASGTKVAFTSAASLVGTEDDIREDDIFVRTLSSPSGGSTTRITTNAGAFHPSISSDGTKVAFAAEASLTGADGDINKDVYTASASGGGVTLVSDCCGAGGLDKPAVVPSVADNGTAVFQSFSDFEAGVPNEQVWAGSGGTPVAVSKNPSVSEDLANGVAEFASVSGNAQFVSFSSIASNLIPADSNGAEDVFLRDMVANTVTRVSVGPGGVEAAGFQLIPTAPPAISGDGRTVAFASDSTNLIGGA